MSFYTDWFIAEESEAAAIASTVITEERSPEDWPNLSLRNIGEPDLAILWGTLRGEPENPKCVMGDLLFQKGDEVFVCRVEDEFLKTLRAIKPAGIKSVATAWHEGETPSEWAESELNGVLRDLIQFAELAAEQGKSVLHLSVL
jgi:hypothetical protein